MDNPWDTLQAAIREARALDSTIARQTNTLADLLVGRMRYVDTYHLRKLKRELRDFDMTRGVWKVRK